MKSAFFAISTLLALPLLGQNIILDHFNTPNLGQVVSRDGVGTTTDLYNLGGPDLLGGSRFMSLAVTSDNGSRANASANGTLLSKMTYENGSGVESILTISYNGNGAGLAQDWSAFTSILFTIDAADQNGTLLLELFSNPDFTGPSATKSTIVPLSINPGLIFPVTFASFLTTGGFDFSDVEALRFSLEGPEAYDMVIDTIAVGQVPEATVPALLLGGLLLVCFGQRR